jgi:HK97 family phage prohead protease
MLTHAGPLEIQQVENDAATITVRGYASVFGTLIDCYPPTVIHPGAFAKTLMENRGDVRVLWMHEFDQPVALPGLMTEDERGLKVEFELSRAVVGDQNFERVRAGIINALSIGFDPIRFDFEEREGGVLVRHLRELRLWEFSLVTWGANRDARITSVQGAQTADGVVRFWLRQAAEVAKLGGEASLSAETIALIEELHRVAKPDAPRGTDDRTQDQGATTPGGTHEEAGDLAPDEAHRLEAREAEIALELLRLDLAGTSLNDHRAMSAIQRDAERTDSCA